MKILKKIALLAALAGVSACVNEPQQMTDVHTGISAGASKTYPVYESLLASVYAQAFVASKGDEVRYGIYVNQIATGMGWSFFHSAYSFGVELPYQVGSNTVLGCGGGCTLREEGMVVLSPQQFAAAQKGGMELKLIGTGNSVVIRVPAEAFREAAAIAPS